MSADPFSGVVPDRRGSPEMLGYVFLAVAEPLQLFTDEPYYEEGPFREFDEAWAACSALVAIAPPEYLVGVMSGYMEPGRFSQDEYDRFRHPPGH